MVSLRSGLQIRGSRIRGVQKDSIRFSIRYWPPSNVEYSTFEAPFFGCQIFDIRLAVRRMSNIRHPKHPSSDVEYWTSEAPFFGCRIFDIRSAVCRMSNIRHPKCVCRMSNNRHPKLTRMTDFYHSTGAVCSLQFLIRHYTIYIE